MSVIRSTLIGGPCYAAFNSKNIQFVGDVGIDAPVTWEDVDTALYGKIDKYVRDLIVKAKGVPRYYDTAQLADMFPYIAANKGTPYPGSSDVPAAFSSNNGDVVTLTSAFIGKMPDFTLGVGAPVMGEIEYWGVLKNSSDATAANSYVTYQTGQSYANPAVPGTAVIGNQEFTAAWGSTTGFASFQAQDSWSVSHELELAPIVIQGRTRAFRLVSYRAMAKCKPLGPTAAQIDAAMSAQAAGSGALGGARGSAINGANLVITGSNSMTVTVGNAFMVSEGFVFGSKPLRAGEVGWVSSLNTGSGGNPSQAALTLA